MIDYLALPNVAAIGDSFMTPDKLVAARDWDGITAVCCTIVKKMHDALPARV